MNELTLNKGDLRQICKLLSQNGKTPAIQRLANLADASCEKTRGLEGTFKISKEKLGYVVIDPALVERTGVNRCKRYLSISG